MAQNVCAEPSRFVLCAVRAVRGSCCVRLALFMSSFVGLLNLNGAPVAPAIIEAMLGRVAHRVTPQGAARASVRCRAAVGLGCAVLPTTPQARLELENPDAQQTLCEGDRELWIVSDARLDNRAELIGALGAGAKAQGWSDGRLILAAYARWGEESVRRLRGDFAYAIWDGHQRRLLCARDVFGVKPFYYAHQPGQWFAFGCEVKALWAVPDLDSSVNPQQIAGFLAARFDDKTSTFYRDVRRLSPASWISLSLAPGQNSAPLAEHLYWELDGHSELAVEGDAPQRDQKYAALVGAAFAEALGERMRCDGKLAVFLSGGLDSSCIAALAERQAPHKPLATLSTIFDRFAQCDERLYIDQTLARGEFEPLWMNGDEISALDDLERILWHLDGPSSGPNVCSAWAQYRLLQDAGVSVVLDGHGGDEIVFKGYERIGELLQNGQFGAAWHELRLTHRHGLIPQTPSSQLWSALLWHARDKRGLGRLTRPLRQRQARRAQASDSTGQLNALSLGVLTPETLELLEHQAPGAALLNTRGHHVAEITSAIQPLALEGIDAISGAHALETRCPFWERQLAQLCVSLPADQKLRDGHNRHVMRRAMQGVLAPDVQWRRDKTDFGPQVTTVLREREGARFERFFELWENAAPGLERYVDLENACAQWQNLQGAPTGSLQAALPAVVLWKIFSLGVWLAAQPPQTTPPPAKF